MIAHGRPALRPQSRPTLSRPPHPVPTFVTMANAPLSERDGGICRSDLGWWRSGIFLRTRLDRANQLEVVAENRTIAHDRYASARLAWCPAARRWRRAL